MLIKQGAALPAILKSIRACVCDTLRMKLGLFSLFDMCVSMSHSSLQNLSKAGILCESIVSKKWRLQTNISLM